METQRSNFAALLVALVLVVAGVIGYLFYADRLGNKELTKIPADKVTYASEGELISGFPRELIVFTETKITGSGEFESELPTGKVVTTKYLTYENSASVFDLYKAYMAYVDNKQYRLVNVENGEDSATLTIKRPSDNLRIEIVNAGEVREVKITMTLH